jgi:hypothetical protein
MSAIAPVPSRSDGARASASERTSELTKTAAFVFAVPFATWAGIAIFWFQLRWAGEAPAYYLASMVFLRALLAGPIQLVTMTVLALLARRAIGRTSWTALAAACALAGVLAFAGDAWGMRCLHGDARAANLVWNWTPHLVGPAVVVLLHCGLPWTRTSAKPAAGAPDGAGDTVARP